MTVRNAVYLKEEDKISFIDLESFKRLRAKRGFKLTGYNPDWYIETIKSII